MGGYGDKEKGYWGPSEQASDPKTRAGTWELITAQERQGCKDKERMVETRQNEVKPGVTDSVRLRPSLHATQMGKRAALRRTLLPLSGNLHL